jgi:hypothetical protein
VIQTDGKQCANVVVIQGVINYLAIAPTFDEAQSAQHLQVLRHR